MDDQGWMRLSVAISAIWLIFCLFRFAIYSSFYAGTPGGDLFLTVLNIILIVGLVLMAAVFGRTFFMRMAARTRPGTHCSQCYARIPDGEEFCPRCGCKRERSATGDDGMKIDFNDLESVSIERFYGGEGSTDACMNVDEVGNRILKGRLAPGCSIGLHRHEKSMEVVFILSGTGKAVCDGQEERLLPGDCHYCPDGSEHCLINDGSESLTFFAVVPKLG